MAKLLLSLTQGCMYAGTKDWRAATLNGHINPHGVLKVVWDIQHAGMRDDQRIIIHVLQWASAPMSCTAKLPVPTTRLAVTS